VQFFAAAHKTQAQVLALLSITAVIGAALLYRTTGIRLRISGA
jgi:hypothetical protein